MVEDDEELCTLLCALLQTQGYRVQPAGDGNEALRLVSEQQPDLVILDVMLPGLDGFAVCQKLKFARPTNLMPIVMLTALADPKCRQRGLRVAADRYLTKPFVPDELFAEIRATLEHRRELLAGNVRSTIQLQMQSDSALREQLNDLLSELFRQTPLSEEDIGRIRYAVLEMTQNAIEWGNRQQRELLVTIGYEVTDSSVKFTIRDEGTGFDPRNIPHAAREGDPLTHMEIREKLGLRDGGFGILIARGMVDHVEYNRAGNEVTLVKHF